MKRLQLAQQGFEQLVQSLHAARDQATSDRVEQWLREEVCPVVLELIDNRSFLLTTRWSVDHLSPGAETPERRVVEEVDGALVRYAAELVTVIGEQQQTSGDAEQGLTRPEVSETDAATLQLIAQRPWFDLVCPTDFFHPSQSLQLNEPIASHTEAFRERELRVPLGDYVARLMFARVEYWKSILYRLGNEISTTLAAGGIQSSRTSERLFNRRIELDGAVSRLSEICNQEKQRRAREACTTLTLVYAAYSPRPSLIWLDFPPGWGEASAGLIRLCIRRPTEIKTVTQTPERNWQFVGEHTESLCDPDTVRRIAGALGDVASFYDVPEDPDDMIDWAQGQARLVLVDHSPRQVFWDGRSTAADWDKCSVAWDLLWVLARNAGQIVDQGMLQHPERHEIRSRRSRLSERLEDCLELDNLIETIRGQGYLLNLAAEGIVLLQEGQRGKLDIIGRRHVR